MSMIYLDNAATTRVCPEAAEAAARCMTELFGNPSSTHAAGRDASDALEGARADIARTLGARPEEVFFTSGGTEGDNWALRSGAYLMRHKGRHIISSQTEHEAVLQTLADLRARGWEVTLLPPGPEGAVRPEDVRTALREDTALVSLMLVNNETGAVTDLPAVRREMRDAGSAALLHTDAVQGYMKLPFTAGALGADMITVSAHKLHAPKGTGALYVRRDVKLPPMMLGGGQERGKRSGTENLPGICAFAAAARAAAADADAFARMATLRARAAETLRAALPSMVVNGGGAPHILSLSLPGYRGEVLLNALDGQGICVSAGSACRKGRRSHVLTAMGLAPGLADGTLRVSLSRYTTEEELDGFCRALIAVCGTIHTKL